MVWEAKIKLAEDVKNTGYWDAVGWKEALAKLTSRPFNACKTPIGERGEEEEQNKKKEEEEKKKREKTPVGGDQA